MCSIRKKVEKVKDMYRRLVQTCQHHETASPREAWGN